MKRVFPKSFIIAETETVSDPQDFHKALGALGAWDWDFGNNVQAEQLTEFAGKLCYKSFNLDCNANLTAVGTKTTEEYIENLINHKHESVLEHATVTVLFVDVSRVLTHELVRHRVGTAYSQESGRYCRIEEMGCYIPACICKSELAVAEFVQAFTTAEARIKRLESLFDYDSIKDFARKKELTSAFRRIAPEGRANTILMTANHRAWRHIFTMRTSEHAEEEIRVVFTALLERFKTRYPALYQDMEV